VQKEDSCRGYCTASVARETHFGGACSRKRSFFSLEEGSSVSNRKGKARAKGNRKLAPSLGPKRYRNSKETFGEKEELLSTDKT